MLARAKAAGRAVVGLTDILFGRVHADLFSLAKRLRLYHSIGAGVDNILNAELAKLWKPIIERKEAPPDADEWAKVKEGKLQYLER